MISFEMDSQPLFYDILEILMAQGIIFSSDQIVQMGNLVPLEAESKTVKLLEKYIDFFSLLSI
jgi:hypothetical protein